MTSESWFEYLWQWSYLGSAVSYKTKESSRRGCSDACCRIALLKKFT